MIEISLKFIINIIMVLCISFKIFNILFFSISSIEEKYVISPDILGQGSFGTVYKATNIATGQSFAMKKIDKQTVSIKNHCLLKLIVMDNIVSPHSDIYIYKK